METTTKAKTDVTHQESTVKVYFSRDYSKFGHKDGNRDLLTRKVNRMINDIQEKGIDLLRYKPINMSLRQSDGKLVIEDGQHRFFVSKQLKRPIYYILMPELAIQEVASINCNTDKWKNQDFINCYRSTGNEHYDFLQEFIDNYGWGLTIAANMLNSGSVAKVGREDKSPLHKVKSGEFTVNHKEETIAFAERMSNFKNWKGWKSKAFMQAIEKIQEAKKIPDWKRLYKMVEEHYDTLESVTDYKSYLQQLENLYNRRLQQRVTIY